MKIEDWLYALLSHLAKPVQLKPSATSATRRSCFWTLNHQPWAQLCIA